MVHLLIIALATGVLVYDDALRHLGPPPAGWVAALVVAGPAMLIAITAWWVCRAALRRLSGKAIRRADRWLSACRLALLPWYAGQLWAGTLPHVRRIVGDPVLLDELIVMLPTLAMLAWTWWCYYPIDRRLRESALIGRLDRGLAVYPVWTRAQFMLSHVRHQLLLVLAPLVLILGWVELAQRYLPIRSTAAMSAAMLAGAGAIFLVSPLIIRCIFDTVPLPPGAVRDRLAHLCAAHDVKVRRLLLWRTFGGMINAAVMGVIAPLRYVMLTDALLDHFPREQVEAVMAHELAHVRQHHMFWLLAFAFAAAGAGDVALTATFGPRVELGAAVALAVTAAVLGWIAAFGWASRRIERQADAFAAAHLAREKQQATIDADSAAVMILALQRVADLNHIPPARRCWRHGSIESRQEALRTLIGQPLQHHSADRAVRTVKLITFILALALILYHLRP